MAKDETDDAARKATAGKTERASSLGRLVMGVQVPPRPAPATVTPLPTPELDSTPPEPFVVRQRAREQQTRIGVAPPRAGSAPMPQIPELVIEPRRPPPAGGLPVASAPPSGPPPGDRKATPPEPPRSLSPSPESGAAKVTVELGGNRIDFRSKNPTALWWLLVGALGLGGGASGAALVRHAEPPPPAPDMLADPCPPGQPATAKTPFCLRLQAAEGAVNSMAWDVEDLKRKVAREHDDVTELQGDVGALKKSTPRIEGVPKK